MAESGVKLDWLIDQLESCVSHQKILLLDTVSENTSAMSSSQMIELIQSTRRGGNPKTSHVLASSNSANGSLRPALAEAFSGAADRQRDNQLDIHELSEFVNSRSAAEGAEQPAQLFLPDDRAPRYSDEARSATLALLAHFSKKKTGPLTIRLEAENATKLSAGQTEPLLACGLLLLQANEYDEALEILEPLRLQHPDLLLVHKAVIWTHFCLRDYKNWLSKSIEIIDGMQKRKESIANYSPSHLFNTRIRDSDSKSTGNGVKSDRIREYRVRPARRHFVT